MTVTHRCDHPPSFLRPEAQDDWFRCLRCSALLHRKELK